MKYITLILILSSFCLVGLCQTDNVADIEKFTPPPPPPDILEINGCIVYINENKEEGKLPFVKVKADNTERMEGVFQMMEMAAFSTPPDPEKFADPSGKNPEAVINKGPVVSEGIAFVRFNLQNGPIHKGDYITISNEPGVGMKATQDGFTVGVALENSDATEKPGLIKVRVMVRYEKF